jgi:hypothetical protein
MWLMDWLARKILPPSLLDPPQGEDRLVPDARQERAKAEADRELLERIEAVSAEVRMHERQLRQ